MLARYAYSDSTIAICHAHYDAPPADLPALGPVLDCRSSSGQHSGCEVCHPRPAEPQPDPDFLAALAADDRSIAYPTHLAMHDGRPVLARCEGRLLTVAEITAIVAERF